MQYTYELPYPISTNRYWRNVSIGLGARCPACGRRRTRKATLLSAAARRYRNAVILSVLEQGRPPEPIAAPTAISVELYPTDRRKRDIDNVAKALLDALTHAAVLEDDSFVEELSIRRGKRVKGGSCAVVIETE